MSELSGWVAGDKATDDARRKVFLMNKAAAHISALTLKVAELERELETMKRAATSS